ncbi:hypothetical protein DESPIG_02614 [Desulfovibrio piger ATCC 29098]|uniref:Uncharacterized protein n=1 Tax=Desulfovibrio piger ATCC 29098 TaxID=411464 RepID=B6WWZ1_9BACT|nr:hypothetical protein DESPIG_02614 [Desulfovibrio piger ATCC 29098]
MLSAIRETPEIISIRPVMRHGAGFPRRSRRLRRPAGPSAAGERGLHPRQ